MLAGAVFNVAALVVCLLAAAVVLERRVVYAAFALAGVMVGLSALYATLGSLFMAALQITLYAGAIMVLFLFVIMLLGPARLKPASGALRLVAAAGLALACGMGVARLGIWAEGVDRLRLPAGLAEVRAVGGAFLGPQLAAFEMGSLLLVAAMIGVILFMRRSAS